MFRVKKNISGGLKRICLQNTDTDEFVSIIPQFGVNINEIVLAKNGTLHSIINGNKDAAAFNGREVFRSAKLMPFPNRLKGGTYTFKDKQYLLDMNYPEEHNACHGFLYNKEFTVKQISEGRDHASAEFVYHYTAFLPGYPFECKICITCAINAGEGFRCRTRIENLSNTPMPVGDGWHPFFTFGKKVNNLSLRFPAEKKVEVDKHLIPTGRSSSFDAFDSLDKIGDITFDTCFKLKPVASRVQTVELYDSEQDIKIQLWQETGKGKYNYLQVYIPPERDSIAIEPMTCNINAFNNLEGLIVLDEGEEFCADYGVKLI